MGEAKLIQEERSLTMAYLENKAMIDARKEREKTAKSKEKSNLIMFPQNEYNVNAIKSYNDSEQKNEISFIQRFLNKCNELFFC